MLRKLVLVLILGNLLLWAWAHGVLRPFGWAPATVEEPQRLRQQWHPEALQLEAPAGSGSGSPDTGAALAQRPQAGSASDPAASSAAPSTAAAASAPTPAAAAAAVASSDAGICLRIGPFAERPDAQLGDALRAAGLPAKSQVQDLPAQWMVLMGPYADAATLQRKLGELRRLSLATTDYAVVSGRPRYMPGISLGVYGRREAAEAALQRLQSHGVQTAHIVQRNLGLQEAWWVLARLDAAQARRARELPALRSARLQPRPCPAAGADDAPAGGAASAAATAAPASDAPAAPRSSRPAARSRR